VTTLLQRTFPSVQLLSYKFIMKDIATSQQVRNLSSPKCPLYIAFSLLRQPQSLAPTREKGPCTINTSSAPKQSSKAPARTIWALTKRREEQDFDAAYRDSQSVGIRSQDQEVNDCPDSWVWTRLRQTTSSERLARRSFYCQMLFCLGR
jgi:hypothetical protein